MLGASAILNNESSRKLGRIKNLFQGRGRRVKIMEWEGRRISLPLLALPISYILAPKWRPFKVVIAAFISSARTPKKIFAIQASLKNNHTSTGIEPMTVTWAV